jgi:replication fork protection complex subunit Tof1/Swi1
VRPADTIRVLFVSRFLMEYLLELRRKANKPDRDLPLSLVAEMTEFATIRWVVARIRMSMDDTPIAFTELQSGVDCFTQVVSWAPYLVDLLRSCLSLTR